MNREPTASPGVRGSQTRRSVIPAMLSVCCLLNASCSAFVGSRQPVALDGVHPDTVIFVDGKEVGRGSVQVDLERDRSHVVIFENSGRQDVRVIDHDWSIYGTLDVLGSIVLLFPGLGLLCPGARSLEPRELRAAVVTGQ